VGEVDAKRRVRGALNPYIAKTLRISYNTIPNPQNNITLMHLPIYLDNAATTPVDPRVAEKMMQYLTPTGHFGNPASSSHIYGQTAKTAVETARAQVAALINADPTEIVWTSGATEANNLALKGAAELYQRQGKHIITLKTEHKSVLDSCQQLEKEGYQVTYLAPESSGLVDLAKLAAAIRPDTIIVSIMHINNETGIIHDLDAIAKLTAERGILFHVDAAQSAGKITIDTQKTQIDLLALCAHKIYGPKGIGALYVRKKPRVKLAAQIHGGGQEQGMRSGTLATHQIVGMGEAFHIAKLEMKKDFEKIQKLSNEFWGELSKIKGVTRNGDAQHCYPGILNVCFPGQKAEDFIKTHPEFAVSSGSACLTKGIEPSYVLRAMGLTNEQAQTAIRFSLGRFNVAWMERSESGEIKPSL